MHRRAMGRGEEGVVQRNHCGCEHKRAAVRAIVNFARKPPENIPEVSPELQNAQYLLILCSDLQGNYV